MGPALEIDETHGLGPAPADVEIDETNEEEEYTLPDYNLDAEEEYTFHDYDPDADEITANGLAPCTKQPLGPSAPVRPHSGAKQKMLEAKEKHEAYLKSEEHQAYLKAQAMKRRAIEARERRAIERFARESPAASAPDASSDLEQHFHVRADFESSYRFKSIVEVWAGSGLRVILGPTS